MEYLVVIKDKSDALPRRQEVRDEHLANAKANQEKGIIVQAGVLLENEKMVGSSLMVSVESEAKLMEFLKSDVYTSNDVWDFDTLQVTEMKIARF